MGQVISVQTSAGLRRKPENFVARRSFVAVCCCQLPQCQRHQGPFPLKSPFNFQFLSFKFLRTSWCPLPGGCVQAMPRRVPFFWLHSMPSDATPTLTQWSLQRCSFAVGPRWCASPELYQATRQTWSTIPNHAKFTRFAALPSCLCLVLQVMHTDC